MKIISFLLLCIATTVYSKCGINYLYIHGSSYIKSCNDMELYEQCYKAENLLNNYLELVNDNLSDNNKSIDFQRYDLKCDENIMCECDSIPSNSDRKVIYCQSIELYDKCLESIQKLNEFNQMLKNNNISISPNILKKMPYLRCGNLNNSKNKCDFDGNTNGAFRVNFSLELISLFLTILIFLF